MTDKDKAMETLTQAVENARTAKRQKRIKREADEALEAAFEDLGHWEELPGCPAYEWKNDVREENTRLGFKEWMGDRLDGSEQGALEFLILSHADDQVNSLAVDQLRVALAERIAEDLQAMTAPDAIKEIYHACTGRLLVYSPTVPGSESQSED